MSNTLRSSLFEKLASCPFSLSLDGSTDAFGDSYLGVFAKFIEIDEDKVNSKLLAVIPMGTSSTGETIYKKIKENIAKNFMRSNMVGPNLGVGARLKAYFPYIVTVKDPSHLYNNIFQKALKAIPKDVTSMINDITSHFNYSSQQVVILHEIQEKNNFPKLTEYWVATYIFEWQLDFIGLQLTAHLLYFTKELLRVGFRTDKISFSTICLIRHLGKGLIAKTYYLLSFCLNNNKSLKRLSNDNATLLF